jgi:hypothetical protein
MAYQTVVDYLRSSRKRANTLDDIEMMRRLDRALVAFESDLCMDIFAEDFKEKWVEEHL